jgi:hypothetical protein
MERPSSADLRRFVERERSHSASRSRTPIKTEDPDNFNQQPTELINRLLPHQFQEFQETDDTNYNSVVQKLIEILRNVEENGISEDGRPNIFNRLINKAFSRKK